MICTQCGQEIPEGCRACPSCGKAVSEAVGAAVSPFRKAGDFGSTPAAASSNTYQEEVSEAVFPAENFAEATSPSEKRFCPNCGAKLPAGVKFCPDCGGKISFIGEAPKAYTDISSRSYRPFPTDKKTPAAPSGSSFAPASHAASAYGVIKEMCESPLTLIAFAAFSLAIFLGIIVSVNTSNSLFGTLMQYASAFGVSDEIRTIKNAVNGASAFLSITSQIPNILIAVGLWMFWSSVKKNCIKVTGITMIQVITIINFVGFGIAILTAEILMIVLASELGQCSDSATGILVAMMFVVALIAVPLALYLWKSLQTIMTIKQTALTNIASDKISRYVGVLLFIGAGVSVISALVSAFSGGGFWAFLSGICSGTASGIFGMMIFTYRTKIQEVMRRAG